MTNIQLWRKELRFIVLCLSACLLIAIVASCAPAGQSANPTRIIQTVEVTRQATRMGTSEATRLVNIPVTVTPSPTLDQTFTPSATPTITRTPSSTPAPEPPRITILVTSACLYGPGSAYLYKYGLNATVWMTVIGRNMDGTWLNIKSPVDPVTNACWIKATLVKFDTGNIKDVPIVWTALPYSTLYKPPAAVSASRVGNEVSIFWQPVWMTEDDYVGYLIETWVCQAGSQVFVPVKYATSFDQNSSMMVVQVRDEPGCDLPSSGRIYTADKHGYTDYRMIPWPGFDGAVTPTLTPLNPPAPSPSLSITNSPLVTSAPEAPVVTILEYSDCFYGPGSIYLYKYSVFASDRMEALGRNMDGSWLYIQAVQGWNPCWIQSSRVRFSVGDLNSLPIVYSRLLIPINTSHQTPAHTGKVLKLPLPGKRSGCLWMIIVVT